MAIAKFVGSVVYYFCCMAFHWHVTKSTYAWGKEKGGLDLQPLPDRLHDFFPPPSLFVKFLTSASVWVPIGHFVWCLYTYGPILQPLSLLVVSLGTLYALRALTFGSTILPDPTQEFKFPKSPIMGATFDLLFSGHMMFTLTFNLVALHQGWTVSTLSKLGWFAFQILHGLGIIASRHHYTVDVWLSFLITPTVFWIVRDVIID